MKINSDELKGKMIDGVVKFLLPKGMKISMRGSRSGATSATHQIGRGVCHGMGISIPQNAMSILGRCRLLGLIGFPVRVGEQVVMSSVKALHVIQYL